MTISSIKFFILGAIFGILIFLISIWSFKSYIIHKMFNNISFFGTTLKNNQVVTTNKDLKLYQEGKKVGELSKGTKLKFIKRVDKLEHYNLNLLFEPFSYKNSTSIILINEDKSIRFGSTELVDIPDLAP